MDQYSPKASPMGAHSPSIQPVDPSGLKMTISLKQKSPFYLLRPEPLPVNEITGATNLMAARGLEHSYQKLTSKILEPNGKAKKMKDTLSSFLTNMPGIIDTPGSQDNSSLRGIIDKPPVCGKEIHQLSHAQLQGFRLHPGPLPEQYRGLTQMHPKKKHKQKKHKHKSSDPFGMEESKGEEEREKKREKKHKKHDKDADEKRKRKKEKKKKKNKEEKDL